MPNPVSPRVFNPQSYLVRVACDKQKEERKENRSARPGPLPAALRRMDFTWCTSSSVS